MTFPSWPVGTVTFLFTDIENSTVLWERFPEQMKAALSAHDAAMRASVEAHDGLIVKTTGDGVHAVFATAPAAVAAALAAQMAMIPTSTSQRSLKTSEVSGDTLPQLRIRAGLHTGDAQLRDGDYYGSAVNRAARIMSIGHGDQILMSAVTAALLDGRLPEHTSLRDLGEHRLRGLNRPERVFQLVSPDLPDAFPPLRIDERLPGNLPDQLTSFIGREAELADVKEHLHQARLLTVTGPGGTGKTRLSLQVGHDLLPAYRHGVWFVELAPLADADLVPQTVASLWELSGSPFTTLEEQLTDYLRAKEMLLILDNCEHLVAACADLAASLLPDAPGLTILASSREGLGVPGEMTFHLPALSVPPRDITTADALRGYEAVQLFVERAQSARAGFALTDQNAQAIGQIVRRLDGIPLAIELAAARTKLMPPAQLASHLDDRFRLLTGGSRTALPRQQTLRALIDWSYDLLDPAEQWFFRQLGVFAGGWTFEAAEALVAAGPPSEVFETSEVIDVFDLLAGLVNKSLIMMDDEAGEARFDFLQTIRQYARDKLFETGETAAARDRHLDYFAGKILALAPMTSSMDQGLTTIGLADAGLPAWADGLRPDLDNIRAALEWAVEADPERALALAMDMAAYFQIDWRDEEGNEWIEASLAELGPLPPPDDEDTARLNALYVNGLILQAYLLGKSGEQQRGYDKVLKAIALARRLGPSFERELATGLITSLRTGAAVGAPDVLDNAVEADRLFDKYNMPLGRVSPLTAVAFAHLMKGDVEEANGILNQVQEILDAETNPIFVALAVLPVSRLAEALQRPEEARAIMMRGLEISRIHQLGGWSAIVLESDLAHLERRQDNLDVAERAYRQTIPVWLEIGNRPAIANQLESFGMLERQRGRLERAATLLGAAEALRDSIDSHMTPQERVEYDHQLAALQAAMDPAELAAAWQAGRDLEMEAAVEFALGR